MFEFASSKLVRPHKWHQFTGFASPFFNQGLLCLDWRGSLWGWFYPRSSTDRMNWHVIREKNPCKGHWSNLNLTVFLSLAEGQQQFCTCVSFMTSNHLERWKYLKDNILTSLYIQEAYFPQMFASCFWENRMINGSDRSLLSTSVMWFVYRILVKFLISQKQISLLSSEVASPSKPTWAFMGTICPGD